MSQGYIPRNGNQSTPTQTAVQYAEPRPVLTGNNRSIEHKNGVFIFAVALAILSAVAGIVAGAAFRGFNFVNGELVAKSFNFEIALLTMLSGLFVAACFFVAAAVIERQNRTIELLKEMRR